jgi:hypothetical protein
MKIYELKDFLKVRMMPISGDLTLPHDEQLSMTQVFAANYFKKSIPNYVLN